MLVSVGVVVIAAVVGVAVMLVSVGVVVMAAVVGVAVVPLAVEIVGAAVVAPIVAAAVVPVLPVGAPAATAPRKAASSALEPPMTTGVGSELMDAFTVLCGFAYADGGINCPVGGACCATLDCVPDGSIVPRNRSR